jgi:ribonuclease-3
MSLEGDLGHTFADPGLLRLALTHRSVSAEDPSRKDNERLEFLGDAVLQLVVTDLLYHEYPRLPEGQMAKVRAAVVSRPTLAAIARSIGIGEHLELAVGEERTGGREKDSILADAIEAIIGAVYLDAGLEASRALIVRHWSGVISERAKSPGVKDYKTRLQEHLARDSQRPIYSVHGTGPDHDRTFTARVTVDEAELGVGIGRSKKAAEQSAAQQALTVLESISDQP